jgi:hypothetical protein
MSISTLALELPTTNNQEFSFENFPVTYLCAGCWHLTHATHIPILTVFYNILVDIYFYFYFIYKTSVILAIVILRLDFIILFYFCWLLFAFRINGSVKL